MENDHTDTAPVRLVPLTELALELPETADQLAARLASDLIIADDLGRRAVPASLARELIVAEAQRRYAVAEAGRKRQSALQERTRALRAKHPVSRGVRIELPEGTLPVTAMTAAADKQFEGGTYRPVPTHLDWMFGAEGGSTIGPTKRQLAEHIQEQKRINKAANQKGGAK
jgi:hypothetical protein